MGPQISKSLFTLILALAAMQPCLGKPRAPATIQDAGAEIKALVCQLWSPDQGERAKAMVDLGNIGPPAAPFLISLLKDLAAHSAERYYAIGKKNRGRKDFQESGHGDPHEIE